MTYDFFAYDQDKIQILDFIFSETDLHVYDLGSPYGQEICRYKTASEIASKFDLRIGGQFAQTFQLWSPLFKGQVVFRKVDLDPKRCDGHTFRYATEGVGLVQLYFGGLDKGTLKHSHIGHMSEKRALGWADTEEAMGHARAWDWKEVIKASRKLKYQIQKKIATTSNDRADVLPAAEKLLKENDVGYW